MNGMKKKEVYECEYCNTYEVFENKETAEAHLERCIMNAENKSYATSKFLGIELYPSFPRFKRKDRELDVAQFIGWYNRAYDTRTGEYIKEDEWHSEVVGYEEAERDITTGYYVSPEKVQSKAYEKFINTLSK